MTESYLLRLLLSVCLGSIIGLEREYRAKGAGARTHSLVSLGSALFMVLSYGGFDFVLEQVPNVSLDPSRIASQVVTGIGFIGGGLIIFQKNVVHGLTTAAGLWVTSAIGMACGAGLFLVSISVTVMVLICMETFHLILNRFSRRNINITLSASTHEEIQRIVEQIKVAGMQVDSFEYQTRTGAQHLACAATLEIKIKHGKKAVDVFDYLSQFDKVTIEHLV